MHSVGGEVWKHRKLCNKYNILISMDKVYTGSIKDAYLSRGSRFNRNASKPLCWTNHNVSFQPVKSKQPDN